MWTQLRGAVPLRLLLARMALCILLALSGLIAYMAYLGIVFDSPFAFSTAQHHWHERTLHQRFHAAITLDSFRNPIPENYGALISFVCFALLLALSITRLRFSLFLIGVGTLLLPYLTLDMTPSMMRFVILCVPAFLTLAILCGKRSALGLLATGLFGALLTAGSALFSQWYWLG
jgi:hypothetical protein